MKKVYRIISNYSEESTTEGISRLTEQEKETYYGLGEDPDIYIFCFDGEKCHWSDGDSTLAIVFADEEKISIIRYLDEKIHRGADKTKYTKIEDITEEVLYSYHDTSVYGFMEHHVRQDMHLYRDQHLSKDDILDKINKIGIESLTENDRRILNEEKTISPFDEIS